jgi:hypothetical protein
MNFLNIISFAIVVAIIFAATMGIFYLARKILGIHSMYARVVIISVLAAFSVYMLLVAVSILKGG